MVINETPRLKTYGKAKVDFHASDMALDKGKWSASRPGHFTFKKGVPITHRIGRQTNFWTCLDAMKKKMFCPDQESNQTPGLVIIPRAY